MVRFYFAEDTPRGATSIGIDWRWALSLAIVLLAGQVITAQQIAGGAPGDISAPVTVQPEPIHGTATSPTIRSSTTSADLSDAQSPVATDGVRGTTYYVSPSGSDNSSGISPGAIGAWKTIDKVNALNFAAGDRILFEGGQSFAGNISLNQGDAGTSAAPIIISSYGQGRALVKAGTGSGLNATNTAGISIVNINFVGSGIKTNGGDGIAFNNSLAGNVTLPYIRIDNVDVSGFGQSGITLKGGAGKSGYHDVRITNAAAHDNGYAGITIGGVFSATSTSYAHQNVYIGYTRAYNNPGYAASFGTGSGIMISDVDGGVIERSVAYHNGANNTSLAGPVGMWTYDSNNVVIQYNESYGNNTASGDGGGFDIDGGTTNSILQYNYSHDNAGAGFLLAQYPDARDFSSNIVRYNISQNDARKNGYGALMLWNGGSGVKNSDFYNNTVFMRPSPGTAPSAMYFMSPTTNTHVRNNVFITTGGVRILDAAAEQVGALFQGNDYWSSGADFLITWAGSSYNTLSAWRRGSGQERIGTTDTGFSVDPKMSNPGRGGTLGDAALLGSLAAYRLRAGSPMIDSALDLSSRFGVNPGPSDFAQNTLPQGPAFDLGAYETAGSVVDHSAPVVSLFAPLNDATVFGTVSLSANASDNLGVTGVLFKVDGTIVGAGTLSSPGTYSVSWNSRTATDGPHALTAVASDAAGNQTVSEGVTATVDSTAPVMGDGAPTGVLQYGTVSAPVTVETDETAMCRFGLAPAGGYAALPYKFATTGGTVHSFTATGLTNGATYTFYARCADLYGNGGLDDYVISFSVAPSAPDTTAPSIPASLGSDLAVPDRP